MRIRKRYHKIAIISILFAVIAIMASECTPMTDEEWAAYCEANTRSYEVVSVSQYLATKTNRYGGIASQDIKYCFSYIGDDGSLHSVDDFQNYEYGLTKVCIGNENKYVVFDEGFDIYETLYLTKETLSEIGKI